MNRDTELLNWLEQRDGWGLINDDAGRWAVASSGTQNIPDPDKPIDITTTFWIDADEWKPTIREAIEAAIKKWQEGPDGS
jgi:hypothetical protein